MIRVFIFVLLVIVTINTNGQFLKKTNRGTSKREIRKRQEEADKKSSYNKFNKLQVMGKKATIVRNDFIWSDATANVVPEGGGDIGLLMPSRYSITRGSEIGGTLGVMPFVPNLYFKKRWLNDKVIISSKHQVYSYTPLLYLSDRADWNLIPQGSNIPNSIALKNELIVSKQFLKEITCGVRKETFLVLTAAIGFDVGIRTNNAEALPIDNKYLTPRGGTVMGNNGFATIRVQADYLVYRGFYLSAAVRGLISDKMYKNALEHNANVKYMLSNKYSVSGGYWITFTKGSGPPILPIIDITYHFGVREARDKGLFGKKGYNTLRK